MSLSSTLTLSVSLLAGSLADRSERDLEQGARCVVPESATTVGAAITALSESIDSPLTVTNRFRRPDEALLAREISLKKREGTFWEIVGSLEEALGLELEMPTPHTLGLREPGDKILWRGDWQNHGAFRLRLFQYRPGSQVRFRLQAEPWMERIDLDVVEAVARPQKKKKGVESMSKGHSNRSSLLDFELNAWFFANEIQGCDTVDLVLQIGAPMGWTNTALPPLAQWKKKAFTLGKGRGKRTLRLLDFERVEKKGEPRLSVALSYDDGMLIGEVTAHDAAGNELPRRSRGGNAKKTSCEFDARELDGDEGSVVLTIHLANGPVTHDLRATFREVPLQK